MRAPASIAVEQLRQRPGYRAVIPRAATPEAWHGRQTHIWNRDKTN